MTRYLVSRSRWQRMSRDYRLGDPRKGTARCLWLIEGEGTCLVPVTVVPDSDDRLGGDGRAVVHSAA